MTTQYTPILKLALPVQGELSGTWGDTVNDNITSMVEEAIAGRSVINSWTTNSHTLTTADGTTAESRAMMLEFTDTGVALTGAGTVICPTASKIYICKNDAGQTVTIKTSAGTGVAIADGETKFVFCDGTNVVEAVTSIETLSTADLTATTADINGGTIDGTVIGGSSAAAGTFTSITGTSANINGTVTADGLTVNATQATLSNDGSNYLLVERTTSGSEGRLYVGVTSSKNQIVSYSGTSGTAGKDLTIEQGNAIGKAVTVHSNNDISFYEDTGTTAKFFWDASAEALGIGTTSPSAPLHVKGTTDGNLLVRGGTLAVSGLTGTALTSVNDAVSATTPLTLEGSEFNFVQSNAVTVKVDSSSNVGIGTSSPAAKLEIGGAGEGIILASPDGTRYKITVANGGILIVTAV